jgi:preprotein translocase subunit YajC
MLGASGGSGFFLLIIVAFAFLWFVLIRPQRRRQTQAAQMLNSLNVGDEVVTAGGIYGEITRLVDDDVMVEIAPNLEVRVARRAIGAVIPKPEPEAPEEHEPEAEEPPAAENDG